MHDMVVGRKTIQRENTYHLLASTFITHTFALSSPVIAIGPHHLSQTETVFITMYVENSDFYSLSIKAKFA